MRRFWLAILILGLLAGPASAQNDKSGRWAGTFPGFTANGLELHLEDDGGGVYRGFASMNPSGPPGAGSYYVRGSKRSSDVMQLEAYSLGPTMLASHVINLTFQGDTAQADIYPIGGKRLASVSLRRVSDQRVAPVGLAYRLEMQDKSRTPLAGAVEVALPDRASGSYKLTGSGRFRLGKGAREGRCTVFTPRYDPGMIIFILREQAQGFEFWPFIARVPAFAAQERPGARLDYLMLVPTELTDPRRITDRGTAVLQTP